jgi:hypothetical protein
MAMPGVGHKLLGEPLGVGSQESPGVPGDRQPSADGNAALDEWHGAHASGWDSHIGRNHRDAISDSGQRDERVRRATLEEHARLDVRELTGGVEPVARSEVAARQEERHIGQFDDLQRAAAGEPIRAGRDGQDVQRAEQTPVKSGVASRHEGQMNIAPLEADGSRTPPSSIR